MTDDELDLLASAYVDGEATPEEVALVERDPELLARVEEFRALSLGAEPVTPPPGLAERHLAAAMAEFQTMIEPGMAAIRSIGPEIGATDPEPTGSVVEPTATDLSDSTQEHPVVDLRNRAGRRSPAPGRGEPADRRDGRPSPTMPTWLPAAAAIVIIGGGLVWAIDQTWRGGGDSTETATATFDTESDAGEDAEGDESVESGATAAEMAPLEANDDSAAADQEDTDEALAADGSMADADAAAPVDDGDRSAGGDDATAEESDRPTTTAQAQPPFEPYLVFDTAPDPETVELDDIEPIEDLDLSRCGPDVATPDLGEPVGFVPVEVAGQPAELFLFVRDDGAEVRILVDETCQRLTPDP